MTLIDYFIKFCDNQQELSYKKICDITNEPYYTGGNVKDKQIDYWNSIAEIQKNGTKYKFISMKTNDVSNEIIQAKLTMAYEILLENMICAVLENNGGKITSVTIRDLMNKTGLVNKNYIDCRYDSSEIEKLINNNTLVPLNNESFDQLDIDLFFDKTENNYKRRVREALKNLEKQCVIEVDEILYKVIKDKNGYAKKLDLTEEEESTKIDIKNEILHKLNKDTIDQLEGKEKSTFYFSWVNQLQNQLNCEHIGFKYNIRVGKKAVQNKLNNIKEEIYKCINDKVIDNLSNNNYITFVDWFINSDTDETNIHEKVKKLKFDQSHTS